MCVLLPVRISVDHPPAFFLATSSISDCAIESLSGDNKTPLCVRLQFRTSAVVIPSSLGVSVSASYLTAKDEPRLASVRRFGCCTMWHHAVFICTVLCACPSRY